MQCTSSDDPRTIAARHPHLRHLALTAALSWLASGCTFVRPPSQPRPTLAVVAAARPAPVAMPALREHRDLGSGHTTGLLVAGEESVRFHLLRNAPAPAGRPLVLCVPILAGGDDLTANVARRMFGHGFDVAYCARAGAALKPPQRGPELDELFRRTVLHQRILLAWLRGSPQPPSDCFVLGMSMGGMVATVLTTQEPELAGTALCLAGADLAGMMIRTSEPRAQTWLRWRHREDGVGDDHLHWELEQFLTHEPIAFGNAIPTAKVLFVGAAFDSVVPRRHQDLLWEALGRPARLQVPLGHYTAALAIDPILGAVAAHFAAQLQRDARARPAS